MYLYLIMCLIQDVCASVAIWRKVRKMCSLNLLPHRKAEEDNEVHEQNWPVDGNVECLKEGQNEGPRLSLESLKA